MSDGAKMFVAWDVSLASLLQMTKSDVKELHEAQLILATYRGLSTATDLAPVTLKNFFVLIQLARSNLQLRFVLSVNPGPDATIILTCHDGNSLPLEAASDERFASLSPSAQQQIMQQFNKSLATSTSIAPLTDAQVLSSLATCSHLDKVMQLAEAIRQHQQQGSQPTEEILQQMMQLAESEPVASQQLQQHVQQLQPYCPPDMNQPAAVEVKQEVKQQQLYQQQQSGSLLHDASELPYVQSQLQSQRQLLLSALIGAAPEPAALMQPAAAAGVTLLPTPSAAAPPTLLSRLVQPPAALAAPAAAPEPPRTTAAVSNIAAHLLGPPGAAAVASWRTAAAAIAPVIPPFMAAAPAAVAVPPDINARSYQPAAYEASTATAWEPGYGKVAGAAAAAGPPAYLTSNSSWTMQGSSVSHKLPGYDSYAADAAADASLRRSSRWEPPAAAAAAGISECARPGSTPMQRWEQPAAAGDRDGISIRPGSRSSRWELPAAGDTGMLQPSSREQLTPPAASTDGRGRHRSGSNCKPRSRSRSRSVEPAQLRSRSRSPRRALTSARSRSRSPARRPYSREAAATAMASAAASAATLQQQLQQWRCHKDLQAPLLQVCLAHPYIAAAMSRPCVEALSRLYGRCPTRATLVLHHWDTVDTRSSRNLEQLLVKNVDSLGGHFHVLPDVKVSLDSLRVDEKASGPPPMVRIWDVDKEVKKQVVQLFNSRLLRAGDIGPVHLALLGEFDGQVALGILKDLEAKLRVWQPPHPGATVGAVLLSIISTAQRQCLNNGGRRSR